jgi:hypothetical protein
VRFVLLGGSHELGSYLANYLIRVRDNVDIVYCSVDGTLPEYIFKRESVETADITDVESLENILKPGDIVINGQISLDPLNFDNIGTKLNEHKNGLINLLGITNKIGVDKVITYAPYILDYSDHINQSNYSSQVPTDQNSAIFKSVKDICEAYWNNEDIGYLESSRLDEEIKVKDKIDEEDSSEEVSDDKEKIDNNSDNKNSKNTSKKELGTSSPTLTKSNVSIEPKPENQVSDEKSSSDPKLPNLVTSVENEPKDSELDKSKGKNFEKSKETEKQDKYTTKLTLVRAPLIIGPFTDFLTHEICYGVKIQSFEVYGKSKKIQSWVTTESLSRAMYLCSNLELNGEICVKSFDASVFDIIEHFEKFNISKTTINRHSMKRISSWLLYNKILRRKVIITNPLTIKKLIFNRKHIVEMENDLFKKLKMSINHKRFVEQSMEWFNKYKLNR